jgi:hypothetical protein
LIESSRSAGVPVRMCRSIGQRGRCPAFRSLHPVPLAASTGTRRPSAANWWDPMRTQPRQAPQSCPPQRGVCSVPLSPQRTRRHLKVRRLRNWLNLLANDGHPSVNFGRDNDTSRRCRPLSCIRCVGVGAMTLGNMRSLGPRSLDVQCVGCGYHTTVNVDTWPDEEPVQAFEPRMRCSQCGHLGASPTSAIGAAGWLFS